MSSPAHNAQDATFTKMMIVHHQGAIAMVNLASTPASADQVRNLTARIKTAQQPEIDQMTRCLSDWGEPTTMPRMAAGSASPSNDMGGVDMSTPMASPPSDAEISSTIPGMTSNDLASLQALTGRPDSELHGPWAGLAVITGSTATVPASAFATFHRRDA